MRHAQCFTSDDDPWSFHDLIICWDFSHLNATRGLGGSAVPMRLMRLPEVSGGGSELLCRSLMTAALRSVCFLYFPSWHLIMQLGCGRHSPSAPGKGIRKQIRENTRESCSFAQNHDMKGLVPCPSLQGQPAVSFGFGISAGTAWIRHKKVWGQNTKRSCCGMGWHGCTRTCKLVKTIVMMVWACCGMDVFRFPCANAASGQQFWGTLDPRRFSTWNRELSTA